MTIYRWAELSSLTPLRNASHTSLLKIHCFQKSSWNVCSDFQVCLNILFKVKFTGVCALKIDGNITSWYVGMCRKYRMCEIFLFPIPNFFLSSKCLGKNAKCDNFVTQNMGPELFISFAHIFPMFLFEARIPVLSSSAGECWYVWHYLFNNLP